MTAENLYSGSSEKRRIRKKQYIVLAAIVAIAVIIIVIVVPVVVTKQKKNNAASSSNTDNSNSNNNNNSTATDTDTDTDTENTTGTDPDIGGASNITFPINTGSGQYPISAYAHITPILTNNGTDIQSKERIFVVGDVHGCVDEFNKLLDAIKFNSTTDQVILAGDLMTKGPDSVGVIRRAKEIGALCVRGNHDDQIVRFKTFELKRGVGAMTPAKDIMPEGNVPDPLRFNDYHAGIARNMTREDYDYISSCPVILHLPFLNNAVIVHGGIDPNIENVYDQIPYLAMTMRNIDKKNKPTADNKVGSQWSAQFNKAQKQLKASNTNVYYGHDASRGLNLRDYTFGLDSGCVYGRRLTAMEIRTHKITQVKCKRYA